MTVTNVAPPEGVWFGCELEALGVTGFDEGDDLPEEFRQLITQVVMVQADLESELVFDSSLLRHNILDAPDPRGRMRMAKFFAEEVRHGYTFWRIAKGLGVELTGRYFREAKRKRQEAFEHIGAVSDWTELAIVNTLTDRMGVFVFKDMSDCSVDVLRAAHPRVDPRALDDAELQALVDGLDGVEISGAPGPGDFEALRAMWHWGA